MAHTASSMNVQELLKASVRNVTEVGCLSGGESFSTEASFWKALSSQPAGVEISTVHQLGVQ